MGVGILERRLAPLRSRITITDKDTWIPYEQRSEEEESWDRERLIVDYERPRILRITTQSAVYTVDVGARNIIRDASPEIASFIGQNISRLHGWLREQGGFAEEVIG